MRLQPLNDRLVLRRITAETHTPGGLFIPEQAKTKSCQGEVLAVGPGPFLRDSSERRPLLVQVGQVVHFLEEKAEEARIDGENYVIVSENDVLGIVEK